MASTTRVLAGPVAPPAGSIAWSRRVRSALWWSLCGLGLALLVAVVIWVLEGVVQSAIPGWRWSIFTEPTNGVGGGLSNTVVGTFVLMLGVGILAGLVGIGTGLFLSEMARPSPLTAVLRSASEVLSGIPSIVFGYTGYVALVVGLHWGFSLLAALIVLSLLVVPYVAKSTEIALNQVPLAYREGGEALGMAKTYLLRKIVVRSAVPGMATGIIVALAISVGETAPLLYTAGFSNSYPSGALTHAPVPYLTYATWTFWNEPTQAVRNLAFDSSVLLVVLVLGLVLAARLVVRLTQRYAPERSRAGRGAARARRGA
ncbi:MAG: ABC transporter permease subunit [Actinomycetota bacterium]|nr:ABC transporter permease subunit [Actinomycetota bacterium]